ncbi:putative global transcription activator SNF2L2 [Aphis craccivora]|uniref:Putative global transcription activator SNF2L2 n=1 Tax=Aphis craccivora TaxID=307492 RepID=A0A6G0ZMV6_APHCR|nr:putative global transcription activator SNF2L2 [Aphis craccivora]
MSQLCRGCYRKHPTKLHVSVIKRAMVDRTNRSPPTRNNRSSRGMLATHLEKLRATAAQLLGKDTVGGCSPECAETAWIGRIRASPTAWALFERRFVEGRRSAQETTPQAEVRSRAGPPGRVPPRRGRFQPGSIRINCRI